jgi:hypothetical protein
MPLNDAIPGIRFVSPAPGMAGPSSRADVAVFAGMVGRIGAPLPDMLRRQLAQGGWLPMQMPEAGDSAAHQALLGLPVPVESWGAFAALYEWDQRPIEPGSSARIPCNLGLAVRSFFAEGGRKAYIVRTGDPVAVVDMAQTLEVFDLAKRALIDWMPLNAPADAADRVPLLPGLNNPSHDADPGVPETWRGMAAIFGIEDAAMLLLPDLIELCAGMPQPVVPPPAPPGPPENFKPCAPVLPAAIPSERPAQPEWRAARLTRTGYAAWARGMRHALDLLGRPRGPAHRRDVMLVGSVPLPLVESGLDAHAGRNPLAILGRADAVIDGDMLFSPGQIGNARLQLAYPWIGTEASAGQPEGIESPEGVFAGLLARSALDKGAFHSAAGQRTRSVLRLAPTLGIADLSEREPGISTWLGDRLSLIGTRYGAIELISDATTADSSAWRPGGISRLMGIILRAARTMGQDLIFEPNGPQIWDQLRARLEAFLEGLRQRGALSGDRPQEAFEVRCDQSTMTQSDIDAGRMIVSIGFLAAFPVQRITVSLALLDPVASPQRSAA